MRLTQIVEALLFASDAPLTAADIARIDERLDEDTVEAVVQELRGEYEETERAFQIYEVAGGYQLLTRPDFAMHLERFETVPQTTRLSSASLEALSIIAYRQPIGRAEVEEIRGVGSSGAIKTLVDRHLVEVVGRGEGLGRPLLYGTTRKFLEHFGLRSLDDMPRPDELPVVLRIRPEPVPPAADEQATATEAVSGEVAAVTASDEQAAPDAASAGGAPIVDRDVTVTAEDLPTDGDVECEMPADGEPTNVTIEPDPIDLNDENVHVSSNPEKFAEVTASAEEPDGSERD